jgi:hypothetical protein
MFKAGTLIYHMNHTSSPGGRGWGFLIQSRFIASDMRLIPGTQTRPEEERKKELKAPHCWCFHVLFKIQNTPDTHRKMV